MSASDRCTLCGRPLAMSPETNAAAIAELREMFGHDDTSKCEIVCDFCYKNVMAWLRTRKAGLN